MSEQAGPATHPIWSWHLTLGIIIFLLSIIVPAAGIPEVTALDPSVTTKSSDSGALLKGAEIQRILAVAAMGKPGYIY